jgi:hypothetical protein
MNLTIAEYDYDPTTMAVANVRGTRVVHLFAQDVRAVSAGEEDDAGTHVLLADRAKIVVVESPSEVMRRVVEERAADGGDNAPTPASPRERLTSLAEDLLRIIVQQNGGIPSRADADGRVVTDSIGREIVRQCRELYAEVETPTERKKVAGRRTARETQDADDGEDDLL